MMSGADRSVEQSFRERKLGDIVIMDNLGSRKSAALPRLIRAADARLWYLSPYSPDLNPIEQAFAKFMRSTQAHSIDDTWRHVGSLVATIAQMNATTTSSMPAPPPSKCETL
jgi:transposase